MRGTDVIGFSAVVVGATVVVVKGNAGSTVVFKKDKAIGSGLVEEDDVVGAS